MSPVGRHLFLKQIPVNKNYQMANFRTETIFAKILVNRIADNKKAPGGAMQNRFDTRIYYSYLLVFWVFNNALPNDCTKFDLGANTGTIENH